MSSSVIFLLLAMAEPSWLDHPLPAKPERMEAVAPAVPPPPEMSVAPPHTISPAVAPTPPPVAPPVKQPYRIGAGDRIRIATFGEDRFSGEFLVNGDGQISFPLFGNIPARGLMIPELMASIADRLRSGYVRDPHVTGEVISFRPIYILGEVARPGEYPYIEGMTIYALIAKAGGFSYRANSKRIYVRHEDAAIEQRVRLESTTPLQPGDTIRVPQRFF